MYYLSLREVLIRNFSGTHDQIIPANQATFVAPPLHDAANAAGCVQCAEDGVVLQKVPVPKAAPAPVVEPDRADAPPAEDSSEEPAGVIGYTVEDVKVAIEQLIATNNKSDFGVTGRPKVGPVSKALGHKPTAEEIDAAWELVEAG